MYSRLNCRVDDAYIYIYIESEIVSSWFISSWFIYIGMCSKEKRKKEKKIENRSRADKQFQSF
jgi:hypothetical protein